jgi:hypothetical protein
MLIRRILMVSCVAAVVASAATSIAQQNSGSQAPPAPAGTPATTWPSLPDLQSATPAELQKCAAALRSQMECDDCNGSGKITTRKKVGERKGGHFKYPEYKNVTSDCELCDGSGYGDWDDIQRELERVTAAICDLDTSNPQASQKLAFAESVLRELLIHDPKALTPKLNRLHEAELRAGRGAPGDLVIVVVEDPIQNFPGIPASARLVRLKSSLTPIVLDNPKSAAKGVGVGLLGGRLAGYHKDSQGNVYPVLQHGFIVYAK